MRIKLGKRIYLCTVVTKTNGKLLLLTTSNGVYTVNCGTTENAEYCHKYLLEYGWYDFSDFEYSN